jgi:ficolin
MKLTALSVALVLIVGGAAAGEQSKAGCGLTWTKYENSYTPGLIPLSAKTEEDCKSACQAKSDCWSIDWNFIDNACYFGTTQKPTRYASTTVNHWDLSCEAPTGKDCVDIRINFPLAKSGVYKIVLPDRKDPLPVYCDMDTGLGGWTVFQRRKDGSQDFNQNWSAYSTGFGNLTGEFWLGNEYLADFTKRRTYRLRIDMENWAGLRTSAEYTDFRVAGADEKYKLTFNTCSYFGDAGDGLKGKHHGMKFSTLDQDNDYNSDGSCAKTYKAGWWFNQCYDSNLNGIYNNTKDGVDWIVFDRPLKFVEMKMRALEF